jgi:parvulin-like peptidyl-prolyl isomerase
MRELGDIADSIYRVAKEAPEQFEKLVEKFDDICTVELEMLGWVPQAAIQGDFKGEIAKAEVDEIIGPYQVGDYIQIIKIEDRREGRQRTLEEDRELLREGARQMKTRKAIESRLERLREKYYIEIRI